jgi:predicted aldo/keto reductase-like oxidoreductase
MRLPLINGDQTNVDETEAIKMVRYAIDNGVNYLDSAWGYHRGKSDIIIGKALQNGYRAMAKVATKLPCPEVTCTADFDRFLNEQLKRLQTEQIDFYLLHHLNAVNWPRMRDLGVLKWADRAIEDGRIANFGFSFHDSFALFQEIIDAYDKWTLCQIQYNYMDEKFQAGTRGLEYAAKKGLAVVVMEPIRGGRLAVPPQPVAKIWAQAAEPKTPPEWALRWVWNHPEVTLALSGMSTMEQVTANIASAGYAYPGNLTTADLALVDRVRTAYRALGPVACTACRYCMPCPNGVDIPKVFDYYNEAMIYNAPEKPRHYYKNPRMFNQEQRADKCIQCGVCQEKCPQKIPIPALLETAHRFLTVTP